MLNPQLNVEQLTQAYAQRGALAIQNFLQPDFAKRLYDALCELDWFLEIKDYSQASMLRVPVSEDLSSWNLIAALDKTENEINRDELFFMRLCCHPEEFSSPVLKEFTDYINADEFLSIVKQITGHPEVTGTWVEATCYDKCCFLGGHRDDHHPGNVVAFVFNLTPQWQIDWGGLLTLLFGGNAPPVLVPPMFNSLNMFNVPLDHLVSSVSLAARGRRYSLTGWLR